MPVMVLYKYTILERVIVQNIILRNVIINQGTAMVDSHISRDEFFNYRPLKNVIFISSYQTSFLYFLTMVHEVPKDNIMRNCYYKAING